MLRWFAALLFAAPTLAGAQQLLEFRSDLAFGAAAVETLAERVYRERLQALETAGSLDTDQALLQRVRRIVARLASAAEDEHPPRLPLVWEIHVCRRCDENAAAMAGRRLLVGQEFVATLALSDDQLGYLLAHEMAHVLAEHTREYATSARFFVGRGHAREYEDLQHELDESIRLQLRMAFLSAQQELEADYVGFILGAKAGFAPEAMLSLLQKLGSDSAALVQSHPSDDRRLRHAEAMLETARRIYARRTSGF